MLHLVIVAAILQATPATDAEARVVEYLKANVKPGQRVVVSDLYNNVFTTAEERAALNRLFNTFFKIPLFVAQYQKAAGRAPTLREISEQFRFDIAGEADLMLRIMEADPRMPKFLTRNADTGEIEGVALDAILAHPRFGKALERTITGFEGRPVPTFAVKAFDGSDLASAALAGKPHLVYFWFTNCPPCLRTTPILAELDKAYKGKGFRIVGLNADRVLEIPATDADRAAYAKQTGIAFTLAHVTPEAQEAFGQVSLFPTFFFVDAKGTIVKHFMNYQDKPALETAINLALQ